jgi:hypothetical protein
MISFVTSVNATRIIWVASASSHTRTLMLKKQLVPEILGDLSNLMWLSAWKDFNELLTLYQTKQPHV